MQKQPQGESIMCTQNSEITAKCVHVLVVLELGTVHNELNGSLGTWIICT
jgi:hypothetical protein